MSCNVIKFQSYLSSFDFTLDCNVNVSISNLDECSYEMKYEIKYKLEYENTVLYDIKYACDFT